MTTAVLQPPKRRSYSQLDTYLTCPESYKFKYVDKIPEDPSVWSIGGTAFHSVAEQYLRGDLGDTPDDDTLRTAWAGAWDSAYRDVLQRNPDANPDVDTWRKANRGKEDADWWQAEGFEMVKRFVAWRHAAGRDLRVFELPDENGEGYYPALELELNVQLGGVQVIAIPDAIVVDEHGQLDIVDYKSGKPPKKSLQLSVYRSAIQAATGLEATFGLYYMARAGQVIAVDLNKYTHSEIEELFADFDARERAGEYPPNPGDACRFCNFKSRCSAYQKESK